MTGMLLTFTFWQKAQKKTLKVIGLPYLDCSDYNISFDIL